MANSSSIKAQGLVIREGVVENIFTIPPNNDVYPAIEGFFEPDGFPGGFDTNKETTILRASGSDTASYDPLTYTISLDDINDVSEDNITPLYSNVPPLSGSSNLTVLESGFSNNTFITTDITVSTGVSTTTQAPSSFINTEYEMLSDNEETFLANTNYIETYAPSGGI